LLVCASVAGRKSEKIQQYSRVRPGKAAIQAQSYSELLRLVKKEGTEHVQRHSQALVLFVEFCTVCYTAV